AVEGQPQYALVDLASRHMTLVFPGQQTVLDAPLDPRLTPGFVIPPSTQMVRRGTDIVARTSCAVWDLRGDTGAGTACITADGLLLRGRGQVEGGLGGSIEATAVTYGPQPASLFALPPGYVRMDLRNTQR
ncbi:MAG: DUF4412 domain-containing protein, partial [Pseudomonadota bacterium]|nr:DUF4412 domain-containing protein [Pseudomonadota bacterium]